MTKTECVEYEIVSVNIWSVKHWLISIDFFIGVISMSNFLKTKTLLPLQKNFLISLSD